MAQLPAKTISSKLATATAIPGIGAIALILIGSFTPGSILRDSDRDKIRDSGVAILISSFAGFGLGYKKEETAYSAQEEQESERR